MPDFLLPDLGEGLTEAEIVSWLVDVGDEVRTDQPVVEVETAKAVVEVPVPFSGTVTALHGRPGQSLAVGRPLITVGPGVDDARGLVEPGMVSGPRRWQHRRQRQCAHRLRDAGISAARAGSTSAPRRQLIRLRLHRSSSHQL